MAKVFLITGEGRRLADAREKFASPVRQTSLFSGPQCSCGKGQPHFWVYPAAGKRQTACKLCLPTVRLTLHLVHEKVWSPDAPLPKRNMQGQTRQTVPATTAPVQTGETVCVDRTFPPGYFD